MECHNGAIRPSSKMSIFLLDEEREETGWCLMGFTEDNKTLPAPPRIIVIVQVGQWVPNAKKPA